MSLALMRLVKCIWILQVRPHTDYLLSGSAGQESVVVATKLPWHRLGSGPAIGRVAKRSFARISIPMTADLFITDAQGPNCQRQVRPRRTHWLFVSFLGKPVGRHMSATRPIRPLASRAMSGSNVAITCRSTTAGGQRLLPRLTNRCSRPKGASRPKIASMACIDDKRSIITH